MKHMKFNHRAFWRTLALFAILDSCLLLAACGDWESQAIQIIGLLGPALTAILQILAAFGVGISPEVMQKFTDWSNQAEAALAEVRTLIAEYKSASATAQPGILNSIQTALQTVVANLQTILPELHITDANTQARVMAAFEAIIGFVTAIQNLLPAVQPQLSDREAKALHSQAEETAKVFRTEFNNAVESFGKQYEI